MAVTLADIVAARANLGGVALHTPIVPSAHLSESYGGDVVLKAENLQRTGSFKIRGAMTSKQAAVATLTLAVAAVQPGEKTAVTTTMAAVTGHRTRITADERDADEREEHRERKAEETLHY